MHIYSDPDAVFEAREANCRRKPTHLFMHCSTTHSCMSQIASGHVQKLAYIHNPLTLLRLVGAWPSILITWTPVQRYATLGRLTGKLSGS